MKAFLVTGASTGIGRAAVERLARRGHTVFAGVRKQEDGDAVRKTGGDSVVPVLLDVTDADGIAAAEKTIRDFVGEAGLDGLVNNAGVALGGPLEYLPIDTWRRQLEVNVIGQVAVTQAFLPLLRRATGRIVFVGSMGGRMGSPMLGPYNASKFALEGITEAFREEMRPWGLRVVLVEPGAIKTDIWDKGRSQVDELETSLGPEAMERYAPLVAQARALIETQERLGIGPERVAAVVERALTSAYPKPRYLVGPDAKAIGVVTRVLPDRTRDLVVRRMLSFYRSSPKRLT
jgi:NAD(P)-dependent dehydrogenase (short-subunit alcohol dehydrogenase family)